MVESRGWENLRKIKGALETVEELRRKLHDVVGKEGTIAAPEVIAAIRELDVGIVEYYRCCSGNAGQGLVKLQVKV